MYIDEHKDIFDLSDHNLMTINFKISINTGSDFNKNTWVVRNYLKIDDTTKKSFLKNVEMMIMDKNVENVAEIDKIISDTADRFMTRTMRIKVNNDKEIKESIWMNDSIRKEIKKRREINRKRRNKPNAEIKQPFWELAVQGAKDKDSNHG